MKTSDTPSGHPPDRDRLRAVWRRIESRSPAPHTSVVIPSLSFDRAELEKILGIQFYEERLLFTLVRLRDPRARVIYVTSQPVHPDIVDYYLRLIRTVSPDEAQQRLTLLCTHDSSPRPLTEKILERPRLLERMRRIIGDPDSAYLTCFNSTELEQSLAGELGIPLNGADPELAWLGSKSGSRRAFEEAGVPTPFGVSGVRTRGDIVAALEAMIDANPAASTAVIKLDHSFAGAGNAVLDLDRPLPAGRDERTGVLGASLPRLRPASGEPPDGFLKKLEAMGGIVEQFLGGRDGSPLRSPSVQMRIDPEGRILVLSTHEQVLEGAIGQTYVGCRFPADERSRTALQTEAMKIGRVLAGYGVLGRFAIDFLVVPDEEGGGETLYAIEINLRMGGTTFPFMALQSLVPGGYDVERGEYVSARGGTRCYFATDNLRSPAYVGLAPEDFFEIARRRGLRFDHASETGPVFHMIGALSQFGRIGATCIAETVDAAEDMYRRVVRILDEECERQGGKWVPATHLLGLPISSME